MKYFLQSFAFTFLMYFGLWIMWVHFAIDIGLDTEYPGSLVYLPHAARVISVSYTHLTLPTKRIV